MMKFPGYHKCEKVSNETLAFRHDMHRNYHDETQ